MRFIQKYFGSSTAKRLAALIALYSLALTAALLLAFSVRFHGHAEWEWWSIRFILTALWLVPLQILALALRRHFSGILSYFRMPELYRLAQALALAAAVALAISHASGEVRLMQRGKMTPVLEWIADWLDLPRESPPDAARLPDLEHHDDATPCQPDTGNPQTNTTATQGTTGTNATATATGGSPVSPQPATSPQPPIASAQGKTDTPVSPPATEGQAGMPVLPSAAAAPNSPDSPATTPAPAPPLTAAARPFPPPLPGTDGRLTPYMVILADALFAFLFVCLLRLFFRVAHDHKNSHNDAHQSGAGRPRRMAILGAGDVGAALAADWLARPGLRRQPIVFLDDNTAKHGLRVHNIPVAGAIAQLGAIKRKYRIDEIVVAIGQVSPRRFREITDLARAHDLHAEVVPSLIEMASGHTRASRIRPVEIQDLLGRDQIPLDNAAIGNLIRGKTVLVTGAGGSIGGELCRQIAAHAPGRLLLVERCETQLFKIEQNLLELGAGPIVQPLLGDITDEARMRHILALHKPDLLFHAAAHKHVFLTERQPWEAIRNNTLGTRLLIDLAIEHSVPRFILISTDKAINPTSVMGATKRMAEIYLQARQTAIPTQNAAGLPPAQTGTGVSPVSPRPTQTPQPSPAHDSIERATSCLGTAETSAPCTTGNPPLPPQKTPPTPAPTQGRTDIPSPPPTRLMAVRFGNVLGSSGSVVPIFTKQIADGGPVRVTHPDVTRYFMTIPEAVGLVLQCAVLGAGGEIFVLNMGKPVKIADLARQMIELSGLRPGTDIPIEYIGLRPGEKLYEELRYDDETHVPTAHPDIMRFIPPPGDLAALDTALAPFSGDIYNHPANTLKRAIQKIVPEYRPHLSE